MSRALVKFIGNKYQFSLFLLIAVYSVGFVTVISGYTDELMTLTPYNLAFAAGIILYNAEGFDRRYAGWFLIIAIAGFLIELLGITTGFIFGAYSYGQTLGIKLLDVPLIIGINWAVLVFVTAALLVSLKWNNWLKSAVAAILMVAYDVLLEPVAIRFDFWNWEGGSIPLQNYLAWWIIAFLFLSGTHQLIPKLRNRMALPVLIIQSLFFLVLILKEGLRLW